MVHSLRAVALVLAIVLGPAAAFAEAPWQTVRGTANDFAVDMPGRAKHSTSTMKTNTGDPYVSHTHIFEAAARAFVVQTAAYPASVDVSNPRGNLQGGIENAAKGMDRKRFDSVQWRSLAGLPAVDAVGRRAGYAIRSFSIIRGRSIYALTYAGPPGSARSADAERFIRSFRFVP